MDNKPDDSWKNYENYKKGKEQLRNSVLQHPDEAKDNKSMFNFIKSNIKRNMWVIPYERFKKGDK